MKDLGTVCKVLAFVCLFQVAFAVRQWNDLRIRFDILKILGFHEIPRSTSHRLMKDFVKVEPEEDFKFPIDFYCYPNDPRACIMYDKQGNVAGVQTSFLKSDVANVKKEHYDYDGTEHFVKTNFFGIPCYSMRVFFTNPEKLTEAGRTNLAETAEGVFIYLNGELYEIPREEPKNNNGRFDDFYKQGCLRSMGQHYFLNVTKSLTDCRKQFPLFPLYEKGSLVGYGLAAVGKGSRLRRDWYEYPPKLALSIITPDRPQCMDDLHHMYGTTSMHVYLVDRPWDIICGCLDKLINYATDWIPFK